MNINLCERNTKNLTTDEIWINVKENVLKAIDETVPTKLINSTKKKLQWITREIETLIRKRNKLFKRMKLHNSSKVVEVYMNIKQAIQKETRKAYWTYMENIICYDENLDETQKQKKLRNYIKNTRKDNTGVSRKQDNSPHRFANSPHFRDN